VLIDTQWAKNGRDILIQENPALYYIYQANLGFANSEHLGATRRADALGSRFAILHGYGFDIFHLFLSTAFNAISLHMFPPFAVLP
jgi:hypothetical protein